MLLQAPRGHCAFVMSAAVQIIQYRLFFSLQTENKLLSVRQTVTGFVQGPEGSRSGRQTWFKVMRCSIFYY